MSKAQQLKQKYSLDEIISDKGMFEQYKKAVESLKKSFNSKIEKIVEVKETLNEIVQLQLQMEWVIDCGEYLENTTERKKLEDLETYYRRAESCKVPKSTPQLKSLETLYISVKDLVIQLKKLMGQTQEERMEVEKDQDYLEIIDFQQKQESLKQKMTLDDVDKLLQKMKELNSTVNFDKEIDFITASRKCQDKYINLITKCYNSYWNKIVNFESTSAEELVSIRNQIDEIAKLEKSIIIALHKYDTYYLKLQWSIDCAYFLSQSENLKMKRDIDECKKLVEASSVIKDIESTKLYLKLNEQLNLFSKVKVSIDQLKKDLKKKKPEEREKLISMASFNEIENALKGITFDESKLFYKEIMKMKKKIESLIKEYQKATENNEKHSLKFWKELLEKFYTSKVPVKCDEEGLLEVLVKDAEEMENQFKTFAKNSGNENKKGSIKKGRKASQQLSDELLKVLERYRYQQVQLPEGEKLLEKWKIKEDALSVIEKRVLKIN